MKITITAIVEMKQTDDSVDEFDANFTCCETVGTATIKMKPESASLGMELFVETEFDHVSNVTILPGIAPFKMTQLGTPRNFACVGKIVTVFDDGIMNIDVNLDRENQADGQVCFSDIPYGDTVPEIGQYVSFNVHGLALFPYSI